MKKENSLQKKCLDKPIDWITHQKHKYLVGIGTLILMVGFISTIFNFIQSKIGATIISLGVTFLIIGIIKEIKNKRLTERDERIKQITMYSLGYSWIFSLLTMVILLWFSISGLLTFKGSTFFIAVFFVMIASAYFFNYYFCKKGVLE